MSDGDWRASIRWVVAHPTEPRVLLDRRGGGLALPTAERPGLGRPHRPGAPGPSLGAVVPAAGPDHRRRRLVQDECRHAPARQRGRGHEGAVRPARRPGAGPAGRRRRARLDGARRLRRHPFLDLATIRRGTSFTGEEDEAELRLRLRDAYLAEWASYEPPTAWWPRRVLADLPA